MENRNFYKPGTQNGLMNLDALFEDMEAQIYFHSNPSPLSPIGHSKLAVVCKTEQGRPRMVLSSPLVGEDFIAGFANQQHPSWVVIPVGQLLTVESLDANATFSKVNSNLLGLIANKLSGVQLRLETKAGSISRAQISAVHGEFIELLTADRLLQLSLSSIISITVENLGALDQRSAT